MRISVVKQSGVFLTAIAGAGFMLLSSAASGGEMQNVSEIQKKISGLLESGKTASVSDLAEEYETASSKIRQATPEHIETLLGIAEAFRMNGKDSKAYEYAEKTNLAARASENSAMRAYARHKLGLFYNRLNQYEKAGENLRSALKDAEKAGKPELEATILNDLGNWNTSRGKSIEAAGFYLKSAEKAMKVKIGSGYRSTSTVDAYINAAKAFLDAGMTEKASIYAVKASDMILASGKSETLYQAVSSMNMLFELSDRTANREAAAPLLARTEKLYRHIEKLVPGIKDRLSLSYAYGGLASFNERRKNFQKAFELNDKAIFNAQNADSDDALMRWHWQSGRLHREKTDVDKAVSEYETAVFYMQKTVASASEDCFGILSSYRNASAHIYLELTDLLLKKASSENNPSEKQKILRRAVDTAELYKNAELQDYFKDECVTALTSKIEGIENIASDAAVLYPLIMKDRLEILLNHREGIEQHTVQIAAEKLSENIKNFRIRLQNPDNRLYLKDSSRIYGWIIKPVEKTLASRNIKTLIIVPDGALRTIPVASLYDGEKFLIQKYRAVTTPGLNLTDPSVMDRKNINVLVGALSEKAQGFAALPGVDAEVEHISGNFDSRILINKDFTTAEIENALQGNQYSVVHIATHGQFSPDPEKTFILTHDGKLSLNDLDRLMKPSRYSDRPVQLLALSACQTAAGDEKAALGLAGIALKSGARCAIATLWSVDDEAASRLVSCFYDELKKTGSTKAEALMTAQNKMISEEKFKHPAFWAPFILIGNWL